MENTGKTKQNPKRTFVVTSALPYANADLHLGHILEAVQTDIYVRFRRMQQHKVVYVCADDTHGTPIQLTAMKRSISEEKLIAGAHESHRRDYRHYNIDFDIYYTTHSEENRFYAQRIYESLKAAGLISRKTVEQFFCEHDQRFLPDRFIKGICPRCSSPDQYGDVCEKCGATYEPIELKEPRCIICKNTPIRKQTEHLFVELSKCKDFLLKFLDAEGVLHPQMRNFVLAWIEQGLRPWCISRDGPYFGFAIPDMPGKYFYVWLDAPIGYVSSTAKWCADNNEDFREFWDKDAQCEPVHFIGKDIVYFHALFWPVMLHHAGLKLPSRIFVHGFLNMQGEKMSKSRGKFILAREFAEGVKHPMAAEYLRFFFASKLGNNASDIDFNIDEFCSRVNTTLANNIGNLHHRTFVFCDRYFGSKVPNAPWDEAIAQLVDSTAVEISALMENVEYKTVVEKIHELGNLGNKYYQDSAPWELIRKDPIKAATVMVTCVNLIKAIAVFLKPIVPKIASSIEKQLRCTLTWDDYRFCLRDTELGATEKLARQIEPADFSSLFGGIDDTVSKSLDVQPSKDELTSLIDIQHFKSLDLQVATVVSAEPIPKSKKLLKLIVDLGKQKRQIVAGIATSYYPQDLIGTQIVVVANLKPAVLMGEKSEGMLLAAQDGEKLVIVSPRVAVSPGSKIS